MIDTGILVTGLIGILTTIVGSWASWFFARKKYNSEVDNNLIENMQESLNFYKQLSDDNRSRLEEVLKRNAELQERNKKIEDEINQLRNQMFNMMSQICLDLTCKIRQNELYQRKKTIKNEKD